MDPTEFPPDKNPIPESKPDWVLALAAIAFIIAWGVVILAMLAPAPVATP